jgi:hypothetical protein
MSRGTQPQTRSVWAPNRVRVTTISVPDGDLPLGTKRGGCGQVQATQEPHMQWQARALPEASQNWSGPNCSIYNRLATQTYSSTNNTGNSKS